MKSELLLVFFMHDPLDLFDRLFRICLFKKNDHIARFAIFADEKALPKWTCQCVAHTLWAGGKTFDPANLIDRLNLLRESLDSAEVS